MSIKCSIRMSVKKEKTTRPQTFDNSSKNKWNAQSFRLSGFQWNTRMNSNTCAITDPESFAKEPKAILLPWEIFNWSPSSVLWRLCFGYCSFHHLTLTFLLISPVRNSIYRIAPCFEPTFYTLTLCPASFRRCCSRAVWRCVSLSAAKCLSAASPSWRPSGPRQQFCCTCWCGTTTSTPKRRPSSAPTCRWSRGTVAHRTFPPLFVM